MDSENFLTLINIILAIGIAQGVLLVILIFHRYTNLFANYFLGALMFCCAVSLLQVYLGESDYYQEYPQLMLLLLGFIFLLGPLHYLYTKFLIHSLTKFRTLDWLHFLPFLLYFIGIIFIFLSGKIQTSSAHLESSFALLNWVFVIQMLIYMYLTLVQIKSYSSKIRDIFSSIERVRLNWLRRITYMATVVVLIFLVENLLSATDFNVTDFHLSSLLSGVYLYTLGYLGISKSEVFSAPDVVKSISGMAETGSHREVNSDQEAGTPYKKYQKSGLSPTTAGKYMDQLIRLMDEQQPYTDNNLTLYQLSTQLSISAHHLSEVINSQLEKNFYDFVNQYRVNRVISDLSNPKKEHLTLLGLALEAGFNSKSSFNTIFKKQTGLTPSAFRKKLVASQSAKA